MLGARRTQFARLVAGIVCGAVLVGCASVRTLSDYRPGDPVFMSGTRFDVALIRQDPVALRRFHSLPPDWPWIDLPFSFIADLFFWVLPRTPAHRAMQSGDERVRHYLRTKSMTISPGSRCT